MNTFGILKAPSSVAWIASIVVVCIVLFGVFFRFNADHTYEVVSGARVTKGSFIGPVCSTSNELFGTIHPLHCENPDLVRTVVTMAPPGVIAYDFLLTFTVTNTLDAPITFNNDNVNQSLAYGFIGCESNPVTLDPQKKALVRCSAINSTAIPGGISVPYVLVYTIQGADYSRPGTRAELWYGDINATIS